jgi:hypothetical protein
VPRSTASSAGVFSPRSGRSAPGRGSPHREQPAPRAQRGPGAFASRCCGYTPRRSRSLAGFYNKIAPCRLPRPGGVHRIDRSGVGCSHREGCPLFPLLNSSLRGWRDYYCDSADRWHDCARYKLSRTGQLVPITLLPNGHDAQLLRPDRGADRSGPAGPGHALKQAPPSQLSSGSPKTAVPMARFEAGPAPAPAPTRLLEPSPPSEVPQLLESPPAVPQPPGHPPARLTRSARRTHGSTRRWWTRLTDWMAAPA